MNEPENLELISYSICFTYLCSYGGIAVQSQNDPVTISTTSETITRLIFWGPLSCLMHTFHIYESCAGDKK